MPDLVISALYVTAVGLAIWIIARNLRGIK